MNSRKPQWLKQLCGTDQPCRRAPGDDARGLPALTAAQAQLRSSESGVSEELRAEKSRAAARQALELAKRLRAEHKARRPRRTKSTP